MTAPYAERDGRGKLRKTIAAAERRRLAAELYSRGATWKQVADEYYRGNQGNASQAIKQFWAEQPKQTVDEIRQRALTKLDEIERLVRATLEKPHYIVAEGRIVRDHQSDCPGMEDGDWKRCRCPKLVDTKPVLEAADRLMKVISEAAAIVPGMRAPARVEQQIESTTKYVINATPDELEQL